MATPLNIPILARLAGRCSDGAERDGGRKIHVILAEGIALPFPCYATALCGAKPGRLSNGWVEVDGAEQPTCPRCAKKGEQLARAHAEGTAINLGRGGTHECGSAEAAEQLAAATNTLAARQEQEARRALRAPLPLGQKLARIVFAKRGNHT